MKKNKRKGINKRIIAYSILGLASLALMFIIDWIFIIGAVICIYLNQKELNRDKGAKNGD